MVTGSGMDATALEALTQARRLLEEVGRSQPRYVTEIHAAAARIAAIEREIQRGQDQSGQDAEHGRRAGVEAAREAAREARSTGGAAGAHGGQSPAEQEGLPPGGVHPGPSP